VEVQRRSFDTGIYGSEDVSEVKTRINDTLGMIESLLSGNAGDADEQGSQSPSEQLIVLVRGNEKEGTGGLKGELITLVRGNEKEGTSGLKGELTSLVHGKEGLMQALDKKAEALKQSIYDYWYNLIGRYIKGESVGEHE